MSESEPEMGTSENVPEQEEPTGEEGPEAVGQDEPAGAEPAVSESELRAQKVQQDYAGSAKTTVGPRVFHLEIRTPRLYLLFVALNLLDLLITRAAINNVGADEGNRLAKSVLVRFGFGGLALYKLALTGMVITLAEIVSRTRPRWALTLMVFGSITMGLVVLWGAWRLVG